MELTPNDIRNHEFPNQMRGYDKDAVDSLLNQIAQVLEKERQDMVLLNANFTRVNEEVERLRQQEEMIKKTAIDARRSADQIIDKAKTDAEEMVTKAKVETEKIISEQKAKLQRLHTQVVKLEEAKDSYLIKLRSTINSHLEAVDSIAMLDYPEEFEELKVAHATVAEPVKNHQPVEPVENVAYESTTDTYQEELPAEEQYEPQQASRVEKQPEAQKPQPVIDDPDRIVVTESSEVEQNSRETLADIPKPEKAMNDVEDSYEEEQQPATAEIPTSDNAPEVSYEAPPAAIDEPYDDQPKANVDPETGWEVTDRPAEEVPPEFIVKGVQEESNPLEQNLAQELDKVAQKFEEEMSKAEQ